MNIFNKNKDFKNTVLRLTQKQKENPSAIITKFFDGSDLGDIRSKIGEMLYASLTSDKGFFEDTRERSDVIFFCLELEAMVEAAFLIHSVHDRK